MSPDRLTVTLPLVWRGDMLFAGPFDLASVHFVQTGQWWAIFGSALSDPNDYPTRTAAMRAVEEAVRKALGADASATGAEGGGDA